MVAQRLQVIQHVGIPTSIRGSEVGREIAKNIGQGNLVPDDLIMPLLSSQGTQVLVAPRMTADLVPVGAHALDDGRVTCGRVLDLPLAAVGADDEEGRRDVVALQQVEEITRVDVRAVVERQGDFAKHAAVADINAIRNIPKQGPWYAGCILARGRLVSIAGRAIGKLASRRSTEGSAGSAYVLHKTKLV